MAIDSHIIATLDVKVSQTCWIDIGVTTHKLVATVGTRT